MNVWIEKHWVEVPKSDFEEFLKVCDDYQRDIFADGEYYEFKRFMCNERFAVAQGDKVFVRPDLLKATA